MQILLVTVEVEDRIAYELSRGVIGNFYPPALPAPLSPMTGLDQISRNRDSLPVLGYTLTDALAVAAHPPVPDAVAVEPRDTAASSKRSGRESDRGY